MNTTLRQARQQHAEAATAVTDISVFTQRQTPAVKTYGPDEATPLDALLAAAPEVANDANADPVAEVARLQSVVNRIEADIEKAEDRLEELEESRAGVVLNGGDLAQLHTGLRDAEQLITTLEAGLIEARGMLQKAQAVESRAGLEQQAATVKAEHYAAAAGALTTMYELLAGVCRATEVLEEHKLAIEGQNQLALQHSRPDLVLDLGRLREAVIDTIGTMHAEVDVPARNGESDAEFEARLLAAVASHAKTSQRVSKAWGKRAKNTAIVRDCHAMHVDQREGEDDRAYTARRWAAVASGMRWARTEGETEAAHHERVRTALARLLKLNRHGESDEAYSLRVGNARAAPQALRASSDPLRAVGEKAVEAIRQYVLGLDAHALRRKHPTVKLQRPGQDDNASEPFAHARFVRR